MLPSHSSAGLKASDALQDIMELRAHMAVGGAGALQRQGFLDAAQEILLQYRGSAGFETAATTAEAELCISLAQVWQVQPDPQALESTVAQS